jgi:hypothetical protein
MDVTFLEMQMSASKSTVRYNVAIQAVCPHASFMNGTTVISSKASASSRQLKVKVRGEGYTGLWQNQM